MQRVLMVVAWAASSSALAVAPATWQHSTEADFRAGDSKSAVATSLGELRLARATEILVPSEEAPSAFSAVVTAGETIYAGAAGECAVYRIRGGKMAKLAEPPGATVGCLLWRDGSLLVGTCGKEAGVYRVDDEGKVAKLWSEEKVKHVWALAAGPRGVLYAGTGPEGKVFAIDRGGKGRLLYHSEKLVKNILCLAQDAKGFLYAGTDEKGLVIAINPVAGTGRIVLDADEQEISVLLPAGDGGIFAATADAAKAAPGEKPQPSAAETGRAPRAPTTRPGAKAAAPTTRPAGEPAPTTRPAGEGGAHRPRPAKTLGETFVGALAGADAGEGVSASEGPRPSAGGSRLRSATTMPSAAAAGAPTDLMRALSAAQAGDEESSGELITISEIKEAMAARAGEGEKAAGGPPRPPSKKGNAVYLIRPDGLVETLFRRPVTILAMVREGEKLILGTGSDGAIYSVTTDGDEVAQLADLEAKQVTSLAAAGAGRIIFATANKGAVGVLGAGYAKQGTFTTKAMDASQIARWGTARVRAEVPRGAKLTFATRSGNVAEPDDKTWGDWSKATPVDDGFIRIASPPGRYLQYRLTLTAGAGGSPVVRAVQLVYQVGNLAPSVRGVTVQARASARPRSGGGESGGRGGGPLYYRQVAVQAADPNGDALDYTIEFRKVGTKPWITLADESRSGGYLWDTRTVDDGFYEIRATVTDAPANPRASVLSAVRLSNHVLVDNTAPTVELAAAAKGGKVTVTGTVKDARSRLTELRYAVDSADEWVALLPADGICDSASEKFSLDLADLEPGAHRIALRAGDIYGNVTYSAVTVIVKK
jgi:hypothetical protein